MRSYPSVVLSTLLLATLSFANPLQPRQHHPGDALVRQVYQFPNETWVENLAVRSNGKILVTFIEKAEVWQVDPTSDPATAEFIHKFPDVLSVLGIAEYAPDKFAVAVGNLSDVTFDFGVGSWSTWSINMGAGGNGHGVEVHRIADIKSAHLLNGITSLPSNPGTVLLADSGAGTVIRLDATTGAHSVAIANVPAMQPNTSANIPLGINGLHFAPGDDEHLYFTNTFKRPVFSRIPVDPKDGSQTGPAEVIVKSVAEFDGAPDDFAIDGSGNAWIANGALDGLLKVGTADGSTGVVLGGTDRSKVIGLTACNFGRSTKDLKQGTLYITNNGGIAAPPPRGIVGGSLWALDTAEL